MKTFLLGLLVAMPMLAVQAAEPVPTQDAPVTTTQAQTDQRTVNQSDARADTDARRNCMRYTGSRITQNRSERADRAMRKDKDAVVDRVDELDRDGCVSASGRVYSRSDLERTGEVDIADALRKLDPAIH
ncbi:MAG TPA: hypothetical protein VLZ76_07910 [Lysobacter sp.]|jgi:hypothetical protein|nr:hypothetical protein [Lysobacter sp.]